MAYYLTLDKRGKEPIILDIDKSKYFTRISKYKGNKASIHEMDIFTMMFDNEDELRRTLLKEGIMPIDECDRSLSIRIKENNVYDKVMYDILYQKDMEYYMNPAKLIAKINDRLIDNDFNFIDEYVKHYRNHWECSSTLPEVRAANNHSIRIGMRSYLFYPEGEADNLLVRMTKLLIYKHFQTKDGTLIYKNEILYRNVHSILAFMNNYDKKQALNEEKIDTIKTKKRTRKKDPIEGQISLFDKENSY